MANWRCKRGSGRRLAGAYRRQPYGWLGVGALTFGLGAALASGAGISHAESPASSDGSSTNAGPSAKPGSAAQHARGSRRGTATASSGPRSVRHRAGPLGAQSAASSPAAQRPSAGEPLTSLHRDGPAEGLAVSGRRPRATSVAAQPEASATADPIGAVVRAFFRRIESTFFNRAPDAVDDEFSTSANLTLTDNVLSNDADPDGDPLKAALVAGPSHGTLTLVADGSFSYTPAAGYAGTDTFTYKLSDASAGFHTHGLFGIFNPGLGHTDTASVTITVAAGPASPGGVLTRIATGAISDWEMDPSGDRIYAVQYWDHSIAVIDTRANDIIHTIELDSAPTHIALSLDGAKLYFVQDVAGAFEPSAGKGLFFSAIDTETWTVEADKIQISGFSGSTTGIVLSPDGEQIFVARNEGLATPVIDAETYAISHTNGGRTEYFTAYLPWDGTVFTPDGRLYVADGSGFVVYDSATNLPTGVTIAVGGHPYGAILSPDGRMLYATTSSDGYGTDSVVVVVDTVLNVKIDEVPIPAYSYHDLRLSPDGTRLYVIQSPADFDETPKPASVTVIDALTNSVIDTVEVGDGRGLRIAELSPDGQRLYILDTGSNSLSRNYVSVFDTESLSGIGNPILVSWGEGGDIWNAYNDATQLRLSPDGTALYVLNGAHGLTVIDTGTAPVDISPSTAARYAPISTSGLFDRLNDYTRTQEDGSQIDYVIEKVLCHDGEIRLVVYAGGTVLFDFAGQPLVENIPAYLGEPDPTLLALINTAVNDDETPIGVEIMLVGYSQGGMEVQNVAAWPEQNYLVTTVVSFAAPITQLADEDEYKTVHIRANGDLVPDIFNVNQLDPNQVTFDADAPTGGNAVEFHGNPATYEYVGAKFDQGTGDQFTGVKENMEKFRGTVIFSYR